jgi:hypothetical protein
MGISLAALKAALGVDIDAEIKALEEQQAALTKRIMEARGGGAGGLLPGGPRKERPPPLLGDGGDTAAADALLQSLQDAKDALLALQAELDPVNAQFAEFARQQEMLSSALAKTTLGEQEQARLLGLLKESVTAFRLEQVGLSDALESTPLEVYNDRMKVLFDLLNEGLPMEQFAAGVRQADADLQGLKDTTDEVSESQSKVQDAARDLGFTFSSAFEDAIINGARLQDVLKGILQDINRIVLRTLVTGPLSAALTKSVSPGGFFGFSHGGGVPGSGIGDTVPAMLTPGEFVINAAATRANRGLLEAINSGAASLRNIQLPRFNAGGAVPGYAGGGMVGGGGASFGDTNVTVMLPPSSMPGGGFDPVDAGATIARMIGQAQRQGIS